MIVLHLESFKSNLFELDFSIFKKRVSTVKPSQENEFFCTVMQYFFRDSCSFLYTKTLLKVSDHVFEKSRHESTTLNEFYYSLMCNSNSFFIRTIL